jgi:predicted DNA-binding transcriptional regulator YafY
MVDYTMSRKKEGKRKVDPYRIWFSREVAGYEKENIWHGSQKIKDQEDGSVIFEAEVAGTEEIKFWVMSWGQKALVVEPKSLRDEIRAEVETMLEQYSKTRERSASL